METSYKWVFSDSKDMEQPITYGKSTMAGGRVYGGGEDTNIDQKLINCNISI
jgi:hypothetical protein